MCARPSWKPPKTDVAIRLAFFDGFAKPRVFRVAVKCNSVAIPDPFDFWRFRGSAKGGGTIHGFGSGRGPCPLARLAVGATLQALNVQKCPAGSFRRLGSLLGACGLLFPLEPFFFDGEGCSSMMPVLMALSTHRSLPHPIPLVGSRENVHT